MLAFACAFTMFAGAAFTDDADIKAADAVDMLTALGVIDGYDDGSFKPDATVTRAEAAKMIFTIRNDGNDDASAYETVTTSFKDINGHWAEGYVKYLQNSGIIAGKSVTEFAPDATVTGVEAAKMMLVAAGYTADKAGLEGAAWVANTMRYANANSLFADVTCSISTALPRQFAAQILYNALDMENVVYSKDIEGFKPATDVQEDKTIGGKYMDLVTYEGVLNASGEFVIDDAATAGKDKIAMASVKKINGTATNKDNNGKRVWEYAEDVTNLVGQYVKVQVGKNDKVYGVFAVASENTVVKGSRFKLSLGNTDSGESSNGSLSCRTTNSRGSDSHVIFCNFLLFNRELYGLGNVANRQSYGVLTGCRIILLIDRGRRIDLLVCGNTVHDTNAKVTGLVSAVRISDLDSRGFAAGILNRIVQRHLSRAAIYQRLSVQQFIDSNSHISRVGRSRAVSRKGRGNVVVAGNDQRIKLVVLAALNGQGNFLRTSILVCINALDILQNQLATLFSVEGQFHNCALVSLALVGAARAGVQPLYVGQTGDVARQRLSAVGRAGDLVYVDNSNFSAVYQQVGRVAGLGSAIRFDNLLAVRLGSNAVFYAGAGLGVNVQNRAVIGQILRRQGDGAGLDLGTLGVNRGDRTSRNTVISRIIPVAQHDFNIWQIVWTSLGSAPE